MILEDYKYLIPEESKGSIAKNVKKLREIEGVLRTIFDKYGFTETLVPMFEYVDLYRIVYDDFDEEKTFKYIGKDGKVIALRWDFTIPIARQYFSQNTSKEAKFSYFGKVYRKEKAYKGKSPENYQAGIELVNKSGVEGNLECLNLLQESMRDLNLANVKLELGSAKLFNRICELVGNKAVLTDILSKKSISEMGKFIGNGKDMDDKLKKFLSKLPRLCGNIDMLNGVMSEVKDEKIFKALNELKNTYEKLENKENIIFDLGMCPTMEYYTCLMFKAYSPYCPEPIVSGGRYDSLYKNFRSDTPAIGMGYYLSNILKSIEKEGEIND